MKLHIHQVIVWPQNPNFSPRVLKFDPTTVSVLTGLSATGKSAILSIIDYVLGSSSCTIPVEKIRDLSSWYGLVVELDNGLLAIARRKPGPKGVSTDYWLDETYAIDKPLVDMPTSTSTLDNIKSMFDQKAGLADMRLVADHSVGFGGRPSFRDMAAFNFLPQHVVANPYTMFYKADSTKHREKLRNVLPFALGVVSNKDLLKMHEIQMLREEIRGLETEARLEAGAIQNWEASARGMYFRAQELNLLAPGDPPKELQELLDILSGVIRDEANVAPNPGRTKDAVARLEDIRQQEASICSAMARRRRKLRKLKSLEKSVAGFSSVLKEQIDRVDGHLWFSDRMAETPCVLCGNESNVAAAELAKLAKPISVLEELTIASASTAPIVDGDVIVLERELLNDEAVLLRIQKVRREFEALENEKGADSSTLETIYKFIGSTEQSIKFFSEASGGAGADTRLEELNARLSLLETKSGVASRHARRAKVSGQITSYIQRFIDKLEIEGAAGTPMLDEKELSVRFLRDGEERPDYIWQIGSGENWMAYHLALMLALHGVFLKRGDKNCVPTFLIIDQPSQVYFPSGTYDNPPAEPSRKQVSSNSKHLNDLESTKQIFSNLSRAHKSFNGALQIIVIDHADRNAWGSVDNIVEVENWREDVDFLIPHAWTA